MSFTNLYYKRATGTPKPCYICYKPTTTVLATVQTVDFLYTCDTHLSDPGFASPFADPAATPAVKKPVSEEEIQRVKAEWEEKQAKRKEKEKEKDKETKEKEKAGDGDKEGGEKSKEKDAKSSDNGEKSTQPPKAAPASTSTHQRFTLHREIFAMRQTTHRNKRQTARANEIAPKLPSVPRN